jgi:hypothetical protein
VETFDDSGQVVFGTDRQPISIKSHRNGQLSMRCRAIGDSPLTIDWTHNGRSISNLIQSSNNASRQILMAEHSTAGQRHRSMLSELHLLTVNQSDSGAYECVARNNLGSNRIAFNVSVLRQPDPPIDVRLFDVSSDSVKLSWRLPFDGYSPLTYIRVYYWLHLPASIHGDHKLRHFQVSPQQTSFLLSQLRPDTSYAVAMAAANQLGESELGKSYMFKSAGKSPTWKASDLTIRHIDHHSMSIEWIWPELANRSLGGSPSEFQLCWRPLDQPNFFIERLPWPPSNKTIASATAPSINSMRLSLRVSPLRPDTEYEIKVRALNRDGFSPDSELIRVRTKAAGPPIAPKITSHQLVSKAYLVLRWQPQTDETSDAVRSNNDDLQLFVVYVERADEHLLAQRVPVPLDQRQITITNLDRGVEYHVSVSAINSNGESPLSDPIIIALPPLSTGSYDSLQVLFSSQFKDSHEHGSFNSGHR